MHAYAECVVTMFTHWGPLVPLPFRLFPLVKDFYCPISFEGSPPPSVLNGKLICLGISPHGSFKSLDPTPPFRLNVSEIYGKSPWPLLIHLSFSLQQPYQGLVCSLPHAEDQFLALPVILCVSLLAEVPLSSLLLPLCSLSWLSSLSPDGRCFKPSIFKLGFLLF